MTLTTTMNSLRCVIFVFTVFSFSKVLGVAVQEEYDFVVVGAGSGGSPLTNRLSENGKFSVLLLEKGGNPSPISQVPAMAASMASTENADPYYVEKQKDRFLGLTNQQVVWLKGKGIGGTSLMNYMAYTFGHRVYYDRWAAAGLPGWSFKEVLPFFKDIETAHIRGANTSLRGGKGELDVTEASVKSEAARAFVQGCKQAGMKFLEDYNSEDPFGVGYFQANIRNGRRCDMGTAFLKDITDRKNLKIQINSLVTKLIINEDTRRVETVQYMKDHETHYVKVNKEVILSAGALASPQILLLSGIGPKEHLREMGIKVIQDLPVGKTVFDHLIYPGLIFALNTSITPQFSETINPDNWAQWLLQGKGPLTVPALAAEVLGFVKTPVANETIDYPDIEYLYISGGFNLDMGTAMKKEWRISDEAYNALWKQFEGKSVWSVFPMLFRPASHGYLKLKSKDPLDHPYLYSGYMTDPENRDCKAIIAAIRMLQEVAKNPALAKYGSKLQLKPTPGCENLKPNSDPFWECHLRHFATTSYHQHCSCRMGTKTDPLAVVDNELKVYGMKNLRIADLSILPSPITGHPSVPSAMIGAKAAHLILKAYS